MPVYVDLLFYICDEILPQYTEFDAAHNLSHVNQVIKNSLELATEFGADVNQVYVIAAYHDLGLPLGRKEHELHSARLLLADERLREWFGEEELSRMAEAVEDHRASRSDPPRSLYGKIISEADRDISYETVLTRTIQYSLAHLPGYTKEEHYVRTLDHIRDKYGEGGYMKLWLDTAKNRAQLAELRRRAANPALLEEDFERIFAEQSAVCRAYTGADYESFRALLGLCFREDYGIPLTGAQLGDLANHITAQAEAGVQRLDLLICGRDAVGFLSYQVDSPESDWCQRAGWGFLRELFVRRDHRGKGYGRRLTAHAEKTLLSCGAGRIYLTAEEMSAEFWKRMGYRNSGEICVKNSGTIYTKEQA